MLVDLRFTVLEALSGEAASATLAATHHFSTK